MVSGRVELRSVLIACDGGVENRRQPVINARSETVHVKRAFHAAFKRRRCLIPANGWFEWRTEGDGKQPWFMAAGDGAPLWLAGLWERWERGSEPIETFTILTTAASPRIDDILRRQPSILEAEDFGEWLAPDSTQDRLLALARRSHDGPFDHWPVSRCANNARNDDPDQLLALEEWTAVEGRSPAGIGTTRKQ